MNKFFLFHTPRTRKLCQSILHQLYSPCFLILDSFCQYTSNNMRRCAFFLHFTPPLNIHHSQIQLFCGFYSIWNHMAEPILQDCEIEKMPPFVVSFWRLINCLPDWSPRFWVISPGTKFFLARLYLGAFSHLNQLDRNVKGDLEINHQICWW